MEEELIKEILNDNKKAINKFYKTYQDRLLNFILRKVSNRKDAEEILQDTFLSALDSLPLFKGDSSLYTWLCSIARHETIDFLRRKKIKTIVFSRLPFLKKIVSQALGPELTLQEKELKLKIWQTLKSLSEGYREILRLKYIDGLSMVEIANQLKVTVKAVESKLFRARMAFQKEFVKDKEIFPEDLKIFTASWDKGELPF